MVFRRRDGDECFREPRPSTGLDSESHSERLDVQLALEKQGAAGLQALGAGLPTPPPR